MHFDVNSNGWNPKIEGDGAMVSDITALTKENAGIYTPLLNIGSQIEVSFEYTFNEDFDQSSTRWIKVCLANSSNEIITELEKVDFIGFQATKRKKFSTQFSNLEPGEYRLSTALRRNGGNASIAVDELKTSAPFQISKVVAIQHPLHCAIILRASQTEPHQVRSSITTTRKITNH